MRLFNAKSGLSGDVQRSNIVAELGNRRDPPLFGQNELLNQFDKLLSIKIRQGQSQRRPFQSQGIALRSEESDIALPIFVSFHSLEALKSIMQTRNKRIKFKFLKRSDGRSRPSLSIIVVNNSHMITMMFPKKQNIRIHLRDVDQLLSFMFDQIVNLNGNSCTLKVLFYDFRDIPLGYAEHCAFNVIVKYLFMTLLS